MADLIGLQSLSLFSDRQERVHSCRSQLYIAVIQSRLRKSTRRPSYAPRVIPAQALIVSNAVKPVETGDWRSGRDSPTQAQAADSP